MTIQYSLSPSNLIMKLGQKIKTSAPHHHLLLFFFCIAKDDNKSKGSLSSFASLFWVVKDDNEPHNSSSSLGCFPCCVIVIYLE